MKIAKAAGLRRKDHIPEEHRTPDRNEVALWIDNHVVAENKWQEMTVTEIAEEVGYSRQHVRHTIQYYFDLLDEDDNVATTENQSQQPNPPSSTDQTTISINGSDMQITIPADADKPSYVRGWLDAYMSLTNQ